jgi:hypothetical protein
MKLHSLALTVVCFSTTCFEQVTIPDGTELLARLDQPLSSATAETGEAVELTVAEAIEVNGIVAVKEGPRDRHRDEPRMGRGGKPGS